MYFGPLNNSTCMFDRIPTSKCEKLPAMIVLSSLPAPPSTGICVVVSIGMAEIADGAINGCPLLSSRSTPSPTLVCGSGDARRATDGAGWWTGHARQTPLAGGQHVCAESPRCVRQAGLPCLQNHASCCFPPLNKVEESHLPWAKHGIEAGKAISLKCIGFGHVSPERRFIHVIEQGGNWYA